MFLPPTLRGHLKICNGVGLKKTRMMPLPEGGKKLMASCIRLDTTAQRAMHAGV